ncbi:MAG: acyl carrier protein [Clostridia bacterium]|nr:acyl carrier protein [Clostridia bacterium]
MLQEIIDIICAYVDVDPASITAESSLRCDVGASSFDLMNIAVEIEEKFRRSVPNSALSGIKTVGDIVSMLES